MNSMTELCDLAYKYGTDKCPKLGHSYTPVYYKLFKDKRKVFKKVLELGIGSAKTMQYVPSHYQLGASLKMWRDFFPNAQIYGVDRHSSCMFEDKRITTVQLDMNWRSSMRSLIEKTGSDIDLLIDDGSHKFEAQSYLLKHLLPLVNKGVIYVIEDSKSPDLLKDLAVSLGYRAESITFSKAHKQDTLVIINK